MSEVFTAMSARRMAWLAQSAQRRIMACLPAIRKTAAEAICDAVQRLGASQVHVVVDCDEEVYRLGYGDIEAVHALREAGVNVRQSSGLRIGLLIVDDCAWVFTPTALFVQPEVHSEETPNAVALLAEAAERLAMAICPPDTSDGQRDDDAAPAEPEVGQASLDGKTVETVAEGLKVAPPIPFDIARQVRVFEPYIQYVEISLRGCAIQRHRVMIPRTMQGLGAAKEIESRLRTTFELIEKSSGLSSKPLEDGLRQLRDDFTRALGKPWGRVLLRSVRPVFDQRVEELRRKLVLHRKKVESELAEKLKASRAQVVEYYLSAVKANPPDSLVGQLLSPQLTDDDMRRWLDAELERVFPQPEELLSTMTLDVQFRDVTFETLNEEGFVEALKKAYPHVDWDKPFTQFLAAKERPDDNARREVGHD